MKSKDIAAALNITPQWFSTLKKEPDYPGGEDVKVIGKWIENRKLAKQATIDAYQSLKDKLTDEQGKLTEVKRKLAELEYEREKDGLVPMSDAKEAVYRTQLALKIQLEAMGSRICFECNPTDSDLAKQVIDDHVAQIFENLQKP